jgi:hypothetical protein
LRVGAGSIDYAGVRETGAAPPQAQRLDLAAELQKIAASASGTQGVRVLHVESGSGASVNGPSGFR